MISLPALLGILNKTTSGYFPYVKSTKNTARYASLTLRPGQARLFEKAWNNDVYLGYPPGKPNIYLPWWQRIKVASGERLNLPLSQEQQEKMTTARACMLDWYLISENKVKRQGLKDLHTGWRLKCVTCAVIAVTLSMVYNGHLITAI